MVEYLDVQHKYRIRSLNIHKITKCLTTSPNVWLYHYLDIFSDVSLDLHWQKSSSTVGCNAIRFAKTWSQKYDKFSTSFTDQVRLLWSSHCEKIHKTHMQSCAIDSRQRLFRCSHRKIFFVSETCKKLSRKHLVSESRDAPSENVYHISHRKDLSGPALHNCNWHQMNVVDVIMDG